MTPALDPVDQYIARTTPAVTLPRRQALAPLDVAGHRYLVAEQGLYLEVRREWIRAILPLAASQVSLPFGAGPKGPEIELLCGAIPRSLLTEFAQMAQAGLPNEVAAWVIWNGQTRQFRLLPLVARFASAALIEYERPELEPGWHLVLDLHSHPSWPASFSSQDDADDAGAGEVKLCGVLGLVSTKPEWAFRLAAGGLFHNIQGAIA